MYLSSPMPRRMGAVPIMANGGARSNVMLWRPPIKGPVLPGPMPRWGGDGGPVSPIVLAPICEYAAPPVGCTYIAKPTPTDPCAVDMQCQPSQQFPPATGGGASAGTPVPAGYPTSQIFVAPNGGFWEYSASQNKWLNVGTPYNTGAGGVPPVNPGTTPSAPTSLATPTTASAPVNVSVAAPSSSYHEILDWLQQDTLGSSIGFSSIPNWIVAAGAAALAWKFSQPAGRSRNPVRRRRTR
jgi:hypothetical protein